ncbi:MAG: hypothetical protein QG626_256 [Patescibacteria group bacterium]|jgi:hypothetical protein|nr:hypothetical protein [Patescibacteria group bacterium]MDQ5952129.1 hypothetical protein [Patescibacteria group bacterium]
MLDRILSLENDLDDKERGDNIRNHIDDTALLCFRVFHQSKNIARD